MKTETPGANRGDGGAGRDADNAQTGPAAHVSNSTNGHALEPCKITIAAHIGLIAGAYKGRDGLIEIAWDRNGNLDRARLFAPHEIDAMLALAEIESLAGNNVYIGPALRRPDAPRDKRADDAAVIASRFAWSDFDDEGAIDKALTAFERLGAAPNWITMTGAVPHARGQCFWALTDDAPLDDLPALNAAIAKRFNGDKMVRNVSRVMRLAGGLAWPRKPGRVLELTRALPERTRAAHYSFAELRDFLAPAAHAAPPPPPPRNGGLGDLPHPHASWGAAALVSATAKVRAAQEGERNATLFKEAAAIGEIVAGGALARDAAAAALADAAREAGLEDGEISATIASAFRRGAEKPRGPAQGEQPPPLGDPEPLLRPMAPAKPFPLEALPEIMQAGVVGIVGRTQVPAALAAQSVMANWALVAQGHANVETVGGGLAPLSIYVLSVAKSGERKTASDSLAGEAVEKREAQLRKENAAGAEKRRVEQASWQKAERKILADKNADRGAVEERLRALGPPPRAPFVPLLTCPEPTFQGLCKLLAEGHGLAGIFSAEGGQFIGGHGLKQDDKLMTATALSETWDGKPIKRVRGGDGVQILAGRRVALHLMVQPNVADGFMSDPLLLGQGLLARFLIAWPESRMGMRFSRNPTLKEVSALSRHTAALGEALKTPLPRPPNASDGDPGELAPRALKLTAGAGAALREFSDWCEALLAPGKAFADPAISGFGNKLCEHAARLAGVFALAENMGAAEVGEATAEAAIAVAQWYADERLRIVEAGATDPKVQLAEALRVWLFDEWQEPNIAASDVAQYGPNAIRDAEKAKVALDLLAARSWLEPLKGGGEVKGKKRKVAWRIRREATP
jgi:hypothetical protein